MSVTIAASTADIPAQLVSKAKGNGGLAPVDLERFWEDEEKARRDPFAADCPQVPLGIRMSWECVFDELGIEEDAWRYQHDTEWANALNKAYNDKAEAIVGRRLLREPARPPAAPADESWPAVKGLEDLFEAERKWSAGSWWLEQSANSNDELAALLDRVEERIANIRAFMLPEGWDEAKARLTALGKKPGLYRGQRGPVTFATSVFGVENLIFLIIDQPDLAARFRDTILNGILAVARTCDEEAGYTPENAPRGWSWCDDNCCLLTPEMYEMFAYPIVQGVFDRYCPAAGDRRFQHSDSAMGHLLPILARTNLSACNFGPTVPVQEIREHMPKTVIHGQLAPFTFSRNEEENIVAEFLRDYEGTKETKGLLFATAGSINNGSRLTGMRLIMSAIQRHGRYE